MQSSLKTTPKQKSWVEDGPERKKKGEKVTLKTEKEPYNRTVQNKTKQELSEKWPQKRTGNKRNES